MSDMTTREGISPTGYVTAEEKDLAEVFLGKQEKAASAMTADSVESINISKVVGFDIPRVYGSRVDLNLSANTNSTKTWKAPASGLLAIHGIRRIENACKLNDTYITNIGTLDESGVIIKLNSGYFPVQKDDVFTVVANYTGGNRAIASFYPLQLIK